ncbi:MAG: sigma-54-dependent transcriptional regulator [Thiotrichales bacterium]
MTADYRVIFVDDEPKAGALFQRFCADCGIRLEVFRDPLAALAQVRERLPDLVITDLLMPNLSGIELLREIRAHDPELPVIIVTGYSSVDNAVEALRLGASDFLRKPYDPEELLRRIQIVLENRTLKRENRDLKLDLVHARGSQRLIGASPAMQALRELIRKLATVRCHVIVSGESGTGKELVAQDLHAFSPQSEQPFIVIDCGAMNDTLLESELFGHEKGAFTGADRQRIGRLESASGGTIFLDEIGNISDAMQTKLLRVVQEQQVTRVGGNRPISIDVRFVVATNRNLEQMVARGEFRHDLYHRLDVITLVVPPLRERREDIPSLLQHYIEHFNQRFHRHAREFNARSMSALLDHGWPGNVRELRNLVERHVALSEGAVLDLQIELRKEPARPELNTSATPPLDYDQPNLATLERRYILRMLEHCQGNRERTAEALGINKSTLWRKLQGYEPTIADLHCKLHP